MILRCTAKLLELLDVRGTELLESPPCEDDWYANLLWVDGKKCLLLTHAGTLFSVFAAGIRKAALRPIGPYIVSVIETELRSESLPADALGQLDPHAVRPTKTASRSTLGFMTDIAYHCRYQAAAAGGLSRCNLSVLNHRLRRTLHNHGPGGYAYPIERVAQRLVARRGEAMS